VTHPRSRGFSRGPTRQRRLTAWDAGPGGTAVTSISSTAATFLGSAITATVEGITAIRIRGKFWATLTSTAAAQDAFIGAFGIGIASLAAVTAGAGSVPTPLTEQGSENWLYWMPVQILAQGTGTLGRELGAFQSFEVDSKAMRKLPTDLSIYAMVELAEVGTAVASFLFDSRVLAKLP